MRIVAVLSELARARVGVAVAALLAVLAAVVVMYRPPDFERRQHDVGIAESLLLVDMPTPELAVGSPANDIAALTERAHLLSALMTRSPIRDEIARRAGVPVTHLITTEKQNWLERTNTVPPVTPLAVSEDDRHSNVVLLDVQALAEGDNPIITIRAKAPTEARAARLSESAIGALQQHVDRAAIEDAVPRERRLVLRELEPPWVKTETKGPSGLLAFCIGCVVFALISATAVGLQRVRTRVVMHSTHAGRVRGI